VSERNPAKSPIRNANNSVIFLVQPVFETYSAIAITIWLNGKNTKHLFAHDCPVTVGKLADFYFDY
jgi:hypothetical protein